MIIGCVDNIEIPVCPDSIISVFVFVKGLK